MNTSYWLEMDAKDGLVFFSRLELIRYYFSVWLFIIKFLLFLGDLLHSPILHLVFGAYLPYSTEPTKSNLIIKFVILQFILFIQENLTIAYTKFKWAIILGEKHWSSYRNGRIHFTFLLGRSFNLRRLAIIITISFLEIGRCSRN